MVDKVRNPFGLSNHLQIMPQTPQTDLPGPTVSRPVPHQRVQCGLDQLGFLLQEQQHTVDELGEEQTQDGGFVQGQKDTDQELTMLGLQRNIESVDDVAEELEQFRNARVRHALESVREQSVCHARAYRRPPLRAHPTVRRVQHAHALLAFARVPRLKKVQKLGAETIAEVKTEQGRVRAVEEQAEEAVDQVEMRPGRFGGQEVGGGQGGGGVGKKIVRVRVRRTFARGKHPGGDKFEI